MSHESARKAWVKLELKVDADKFEELAIFIARASIGAHLLNSEKKTSVEIHEAAQEAASLVERLIKLIERNATLQSFTREDILSPIECAAFDRLGGVISAVRSKAPSDSGRWFSQEIESELDESQLRLHPECKGLTTSSAWKIVCVDSKYFQPDFFVSNLRNFAEFARLSGEFEPLTPKPNSQNTDLHLYSLRVCNILNEFCGSPNHSIVADLASAVFNVVVDTESVKKWWLRRGT